MKNEWMILIARERAEQVHLHGHTVETDMENNTEEQLAKGAIALLSKDLQPDLSAEEVEKLAPEGWDVEKWVKMYNKPRKERTVIACALMAAQIDVMLRLEEER